MPRPRVVVITGFGAFGEHSRNPSEDVAKSLESARIEGADQVVVRIMQVVYDDVTEIVQKLWRNTNRRFRRILMIHIGVNGMTPRKVSLEGQAFHDGYCRYDVQGRVPHNNSCPGGEGAKQSALDVAALAEEASRLLGKDLPPHFAITESDDPGRYLCGFSYYQSLCQGAGRALFIHIPVLDEDITIELLAQVVSTVISLILTKKYMKPE